MRVLFDGFWWTEGPIANRTVMREMIFGWSRAFPSDEIVVAIRAKHAERVDLPVNARMVLTRTRPQALANVLELPALARRTKADLVLSHNYTAPHRSSVVFIHDLLFEESRTWFTRRELLYFWPMSRLARFAKVVLTSSRSEADRIERLHPGLAPVAATGLAVAPALAGADSRKPSFLPPQVKTFHLCVGRLNPRKNLENAIAGALLSGCLSRESPLVIVGSSAYSGAGANLPGDLKQHVSAGLIIFAGKVPDAELKWLYQNCDALIFMSRDEGFGLPPVEAAFFGSTTIVSDLPVMREVAPGSIAFVNPDRPEELASAMKLAVDRPLKLPKGVSDAEQDWADVARHARSAAIRPRTRLEGRRGGK